MKKTVTLNPGESKVVGFSFTPTAAKSYGVSVNGLVGSFIAIEAPAAEFTVSDLVIEPIEVYIGEPVSIAVIVTNLGGKAGSYEVTCEVL